MYKKTKKIQTNSEILPFVRNLTKDIGRDLPQNILFYDIETTGLSPQKNEVYLIGMIHTEGSEFLLTQLLAETADEEAAVLEEFRGYLKPPALCIQFNGNRFDEPFLSARCGYHGIPDPFERKEVCSVDLYRKFLPLKKLLTLPSLRQTALERYLSLPERTCPDGKACISLYQEYVRTKSPETRNICLGHNAEDLRGLTDILRLAPFLQLYDGSYAAAFSAEADGRLIFELHPALPLPAVFSFRNDHVYVTGGPERVRVSVPLKDGRIRQYYADYKNYDYLPAEDMAVPRTLSAFLSRELKQKAGPENCYTWINAGDSFRSDPAICLEYLQHSLPILLSL